MADWPYSTVAWLRLRRLKLSETPLCEACTRRGRHIIAEHVDHVVSIASGGEAFPPTAGLMSLCPSCHSIKTNAMDRKGGKGVAFKGCDVNGLPLDPDHPFLQDRAGEEGNGTRGKEQRVPDPMGRGSFGGGRHLCRNCLDRSEAGPSGNRGGLARGNARTALGANESLVKRDSPLQGRGAVDQGPAWETQTQLVRDWSV